MENKISWDEVWKTWRNCCRELYPEMIEPTPFLNIAVDFRTYGFDGDKLIDWWPNETVTERKDAISQRRNIALAGWETTTGYKRTAERLWEHSDDPESHALLWIGAALFQMETQLPYDWRGDVYRLIEDVYLPVLRRMDEKHIWRWQRPTKYTLPNTISTNYRYSSLLKPKDYHDIINIAALDNILTRQTWTLVRLHYQL